MDLVAIHLSALSLTAIAILYADHMGYQYFTGKRLHLNHERTVMLHRIVWVGLVAMIVSGYFLTAPQWEHFRSEPAFFIKLGLVLVLVMNAFVIGKMAHLTSDRAFAELPSDVQKTLMISGALSIIGWIGATIIGYFFL
jgi:hypothetical protein